MGDQTKNMLIGTFVIAACGVIIWLILFLKPTVGDGKETLYVRFSNVNQINVGTRVLFAGKPVGEVVAIQHIYDARQKPIVDELGEIYYYQLVLKVDSSVRVYDTDEITITTSGLLGEKSIAIIPKAPPKGVIPKLVSNQPIYAESVDPIEHTFKQISELAEDMQVTFQEATAWIQNNGVAMGDAIRSFGSAMDEIDRTICTFNEEQMIDQIKLAVENFSSTFQEVRKAVQELQDEEFFANASVVMRNIKSASQNFNLITEDIADGKGTLGRLIKGDELYLQLTSTMSKVDTLMNDINHYGLLFYLNKAWQRQRGQRITAMNALENPQNFKQYFENEVDDIKVSMSRLSMLIDKAELSPEKEAIFDNTQFRKDFAELMRQAEILSDNLRLYNQQLMEATNP